MQLCHIMKSNEHKKLPLCRNPKYFFPDISYTNSIPALARDNNCEMNPSVSRMITLIRRSGLLKYGDVFADFITDENIEEAILQGIRDYKEGDRTDLIFHLIEAWGGSAGRGFYIHHRGNMVALTHTLKAYEELINTCLHTKDTDSDSMTRLVNAGRAFDKAAPFIGISFITKHIHFWLTKNLGDNALPIFDSVVSVWVMRQSQPEWSHLNEYWNVMKDKATETGISLRALERQVFNYALRHK